jgi:hypothetical protein
MEFFIGSVVTIIAYVVTNRLINNGAAGSMRIPAVRYSQSHVYSLVSPYLDFAPLATTKALTQAQNYYNNVYVKILVANGKAYWIKDNTFYVAEFKEGMVDKDTTKAVDTMSMSKSEISQMMFIVEKLKEGSHDDNWNPGKPRL